MRRDDDVVQVGPASRDTKKGLGSEAPVWAMMAGSVMKPSPQHMAPWYVCPLPWMKNSVVGETCA